MGMYTELIVGCRLHSGTDVEVTEHLRGMIAGANWDGPDTALLVSSSQYFGVNEPCCTMWYSSAWQAWHLSLRCNTQFPSMIEEFLAWLEPYVAQGSGARDVWAMVWPEEADVPTVYALREGQ